MDRRINRQYHQSTRKQLESVLPAKQTSFYLDLSEGPGHDDVLRCDKILRRLPGRRLACAGQWRGQTVFAKVFFDSKRSKIHWRREEAGARALRDKGILTPHLIHSHFHAQEKIYLSIFEYIQPSISVAQAWNASADERKQQILEKLAGVLAAHHSGGILQRDLHLENFLLADELIYTLDGAGVISRNRPVNEKDSLLNLANLFAQLDAKYDRWLALLYKKYCDFRQRPMTDAGRKKLAKLVKKRRVVRKDYILKKTTRECSAFVCQKSWRRFMVLDRNYDSQNLRAFLAAPDQHMATAQIIKAGNTSTLVKVRIDNRDILVKRYNIKNWKHALSRAFRRTRAWHSWRNSQLLMFYGIETPAPMALVENRWGPIRRNAYFVTGYVDGVDALAYFNDDLRADGSKRLVAQRLKMLFEKLSRFRISHGDFKATNFLVRDGGVFLIDLDSMREHKSEIMFRRAWRKDMRRFFCNWSDHQRLMDLFRDQLRQHP